MKLKVDFAVVLKVPLEQSVEILLVLFPVFDFGADVLDDQFVGVDSLLVLGVVVAEDGVS